MIVNVLLAILGLALLLFGLWWVWPPLAPIVGGLFLLAVAFLREVPDGSARR